MASRTSVTLTVTTALLLGLPQAALAQPAGEPVLTVDPPELASVQAPDELASHELTIGNDGDAELEWRLLTGTDQPRRSPIGPATPVATVPAPDPSGEATWEDFPGHSGRPGWTVEPALPEPPEDGFTLTHTTSPAVVAGSSLACARRGGLRTAATGYLRQFTLPDFGITGDLEVSAVSFGVESVRGATRPVTVNLYTMVDPAGLLEYRNLALIGTAERVLGNQSMTLVEVPVAGTAPAGATLVVEVAAPDLDRGGFYLGAHPGEQTAPSYLRAEACGIPEPVPAAELGAPQLRLWLEVTGSAPVAACDVPDGTPWLAVEPRAGTVAAGAEQPVALRFDATGQPDGAMLAASLCLASNDPAAPWREVPVAMTVDDPCDRRIAGPHPGPLTVTSGVTCLEPGARVEGAVNVLDRAGLVADSATVQGPVAAFGAATVELRHTHVVGPVTVRGTTGSVALAGNQVVGSILIAGNRTGTGPPVVSGNLIVGSLLCTDNQPPPIHDGVLNTIAGGAAGECAGF